MFPPPNCLVGKIPGGGCEWVRGQKKVCVPNQPQLSGPFSPEENFSDVGGRVGRPGLGACKRHTVPFKAALPVSSLTCPNRCRGPSIAIPRFLSRTARSGGPFAVSIRYGPRPTSAPFKAPPLPPPSLTIGTRCRSLTTTTTKLQRTFYGAYTWEGELRRRVTDGGHRAANGDWRLIDSVAA